MSFVKKMLESTPEGIRTRLGYLLGLEGLESPAQLSDFEDNPAAYRAVTSWELFSKATQAVRDRKARYAEYDRMDEDADIKAALDAYAEEVTQRNRDKNMTIWATGESEEMVNEIHDLLKRLKVEEWMYGLARSIAKYGDDFEQVYYDENGVYHVKYIEPTRLDINRNDQGMVTGYRIAGQTSSASTTVAIAQPWDFVHFKINGAIRDGWGESMLAGVLKAWRILNMLETALALYRLYRAADRTIFYIDVGTQTPDQQYATVEKWRQTFRKRRWFDSSKNEIDFKQNPIDLLEDIFWPTAKDSPSKVDRLQGSSNVGDIADVEMFRNKLRNALGIPPGYFGGSENSGMFNAASGLAQQDMHFARRVERLQDALIAGFTKLIQINFSVQGIDPNSMQFELRMEPLSYLSEMQRLEAINSQIMALQGLVQTFQMMGFDPVATAEFCLKYALHVSDDDLRGFLQSQIENMAAAMEQQNDMMQQQQSQMAFDNAQKGMQQKVTTPGGNSGATVSSGKKAATNTKKAPKSQTEWRKKGSKVLTEDADFSALTPEMESEFLGSVDAFLKEHRGALEILKSQLDEIPEDIIELEK